MNFGLQLASTEFSRLRDVAQTADGLGFHALYMPDHLVFEGPERYVDPEMNAFDPIVEAAVVAEATRRVKIGHLVLCNLFRHPAVTARSLATLDHLSGGRLIAGLGSGWTETEFRMTGIAFPDVGPRLRMLDEALTCIRRLWTEEPANFEGEFYKLTGASLRPKPVQKPAPPFLLGGSGRGLLRIAARHADIVNITAETGKVGYISMAKVGKLTEQTFLRKLEFLRAAAREEGRDPAGIRVGVQVPVVVVSESPAAARTVAENMGAAFGQTPEELRRVPLNLIGTPEEIVTELERRRRQWGLTDVVLSLRGADVLRTLGEKVLPHVAG